MMHANVDTRKRPSPDNKAALQTRIVTEARSWMGTPFVHEGAVKGVGVDCVQLARMVFVNVGIAPADFPTFAPYPTGWLLEHSDHRYEDAISRHMTRVWKLGDPMIFPEPGDLALFALGRAGAHSAIVTMWPRVIHAWDEDCVVETKAHGNVLDKRSRRLISVWRASVLCG